MSAQDNFNLSKIGSALLSPSLIDIELRDDLAFCADEYGFSVWDISDLENPERIGQCSTRGNAVSCVINGEYAYVSDVGYGVAVVDISEPDNPNVIRYLELLIHYQWWGQAAPPEIVVKDNLLYICAGWYGMYIADLEDPENPELINYYQELGIDVIQFYGEITYLTAGYGDVDLHILNINDPRNIDVIATIDFNYTPYGFAIQDDMMAIWSMRDGLFIYSLEDPSQPEQIGWRHANNMSTIHLQDDYAYGIFTKDKNRFTEMGIFDISEPAEIEVWGSDFLCSGHDMALESENLFIASHNRGIGVVSVEDPEELVLLNEWVEYYTTNYVTVAGNYAYLSDEFYGLRIVDVRDSENPVQVGSFEAELGNDRANVGYVMNSIYIDDHLYTLVKSGRWPHLLTLDVSNPEEPNEVDFTEFRFTYSSHFSIDEYLCLVGWHTIADGRDRSYANIQVFDTSEPGILELVFRNEVDLGSNFHSSSDGDYLYMSSWDRLDYKMDVYSVADITEPEFVGTWEEGGSWGIFLVHNGIMYVNDYTHIMVYDVNNPMEPEVIDRIDLDVNFGGNLYLEGEMIYLDLSESGFYCMSIADPRNPEIVGYYDTPGNVGWIDAQDGYIYVADKYEMGIYQYQDDGGVDDRFTIRLAPGWNLISSPYDPTNPSIESIFSRMTNRGNLIMVKDYLGHFYLPEQFNNVPDWDVNQGYQVKVSDVESVRILGDPVEFDRPIQLPQGWSMTSYFPDVEVQTEIAFANITDQLLMAKNEAGNFYLPEFGFNNIPPLHRGEGYQVKTTEEIELVWNVEEDERQAGQPFHLSIPNHFVSVPPTDGNMSILIQNVDIAGEIGVFTENGMCVGASVVTGVDVGLVVWGDDPTTEDIDGAIESDELVFKIWDGVSEYVTEFEPMKGEGYWKLDGLLVGALTLAEIVPVNFGITSAYPNPFNSTIQVSYGLFETGLVHLSIYDLSGREIVTLVDSELTLGTHRINWNAGGIATGVYFVRLEQGNQTAVMKILLVR